MRLGHLVLVPLLLAAGSIDAGAATVEAEPGDGTLQAAIDQAQDGDTIVLAAGTYTGEASISGKSDLHILGRGKVVLDGDAQNDTPIRITGSQRIVIEKVTLRNVNRGIQISGGSADITVLRCRFEETRDSAVEATGTDDVTVERCKFVNAAYPVFLDNSGADGCDRAVVTRCKMTGIGDNLLGIYCAGEDGVISRNKLASAPEAADSYGIQMDQIATNCRIERNKCTGFTAVAIRVSGTGNTAFKNKVTTVLTGIQVDGTGGHTIEKNKVKGATNIAFHVYSTGNTFTRNKALDTDTSNGGLDLLSQADEIDNVYDGNNFVAVQFPDP